MLDIVAKRKTTPDAAGGAGEGSGPDRHKHMVLSLRPPPGIRAELERLAEQEERSLAQMALIILREGLAARKGGPL
jgi:hypothetical protein